MSLAARRCYNHPERVVAVRCPECGRFYCRECASEFKDRFLCKICLESQLLETKNSSSSLQGRLRRGAGFAVGLLLCWFLFYGLARMIFAIPGYFHSGFSHYEEKK